MSSNVSHPAGVHDRLASKTEIWPPSHRHHLNFSHIRTTLSPVDLWTGPAEVTAGTAGHMVGVAG